MPPDMIVAAFAILVGVVLALIVARRISKSEKRSLGGGNPAENVNGLAAGILREIALIGGATPEAATELARARSGWASPPEERIDVPNWGEAYAGACDPSKRMELLETAATLAMTQSRRVPAEQYSALMALSFALGFHTDALAQLRNRLGFEYDDWARLGRPRSADRDGGGAPLFQRPERARVAELLAVLGLAEAQADRQHVAAAYRHLAADCHPDRFHETTTEERAAAAERFRELSAAYQTLMQVLDRD